MAYYETTWYCNAGDQSTTGHYAVAKRPQNTAVVAGQLCRQFTAPAVNSERVFICIIAGTTANVTDATWVLTRGAKTVDGTATWMEVTGIAAVNGDKTNTVNWTAAKAIGATTLGTIIQRNNGASYQICTTAGTLGASEPVFSDTAGATTTETAGTTVWTSLGVVGNFTGGQAPHARLGTVVNSGTWFVAGNTVYIGDNHAESQATAITINPTGSNVLSSIVCHNHSGSYPPTTGNITTGATISTTAAANINFTYSGSFYFYGITAKLGVGASGGVAVLALAPLAGSFSFFDSCSFWIVTTGATASNIQIGGTGVANSTIVFNNTTVKFADIANKISPGNGSFIWQNTGQIMVSGSSIPNGGFFSFGVAATSTYGAIVLEAIDLSQINTNLFGFQNNNVPGSVLIKDCKLNASLSILQPTAPGMMFQVVRSDSSGTAYKSTRYLFEGTETTETSITRVGGASDPTGQAQSRKIVTTANSLWLRPFKAEPYAIWNPITGANVTVTVCGTVNAGALPNNDDIWLEVEYLGSSSSPLGTMVTTTKANLLAANAAVASDGSTWNGGGSGAGWSPFKLTATLSAPQPGMAGYLHARVRAAKPSTTYYIDPKVILS